VGRLIWLHKGGRRLRSIRLACQMTTEEFADLLYAELGWYVPSSVLQAWEDGRGEPPRQVVDKAQSLADSRLIATVSRRQFLRGTATVAGLTAIALGSGQFRASGEEDTPIPAVGVRGNLHGDSLSDLEALVSDYRRSYGQISAEELLPRASGLLRVLLDLEEAPQSPALRSRLTSLVGQTGLLAGLVSLMGPHDLVAARSYYDLALRAATDAGDADLATYVQGSLSFHATREGKHTEGLQRIRAAREAVDDRSSPMTQAWLASLVSEFHARAGDHLACMRCLEQSEAALDADEGRGRAWKGVGVFDRGKLVAYRGGDLVLLAATSHGAMAVRRAREAEALLVDALAQLDVSRVKHRCTALGDIAMTLALQDEVEQACLRAREALELAVQLGHRESVGRVQTVHHRLQRWGSHQAVRDLGEQLLLAT
jgi:hypothetical protein